VEKNLKPLAGVVPAIFLIAAVVLALTPSIANAEKPMAGAAKLKPTPTATGKPTRTTTTTTSIVPTTTTTGPTTTTTIVPTTTTTTTTSTTVAPTATSTTSTSTAAVTISMEGWGDGTVTSSPAGINCHLVTAGDPYGSDFNQVLTGPCEANFPVGSVVTLTGTPDAGSYTGDLLCGSTSGNPCRKTVVDGFNLVVATFCHYEEVCSAG
jgi:hypothetical protein